MGSNPTPRTTEDLYAVLEVLLRLRSQCYSDSTLEGMGKRLRRLARKVDLKAPEKVKQFIAAQTWSSGYKGNVVNAYNHYVEFHGLHWEKPS